MVCILWPVELNGTYIHGIQPRALSASDHNSKEGSMAESVSEIISRLGLSEGDFRQDAVVKTIEDPMSDPWSLVYDVTGTPMKSTHVFSCFARGELR